MLSLDESPNARAISEFLRVNVRFMLKTPAPATTPLRPPIALTKEEQEVVNERMAEFRNHDR